MDQEDSLVDELAKLCTSAATLNGLAGVLQARPDSHMDYVVEEPRVSTRVHDSRGRASCSDPRGIAIIFIILFRPGVFIDSVLKMILYGPRVRINYFLVLEVFGKLFLIFSHILEILEIKFFTCSPILEILEVEVSNILYNPGNTGGARAAPGVRLWGLGLFLEHVPGKMNMVTFELRSKQALFSK